MILCLVGAVRGEIAKTYQRIQSHNLPIDWLLCTGSFGTWPDPAKIDRATKNREGAGDFARYYLQGPENRLQTLYISGAHEDHNWLQHRKEIGQMEVLSNVHWLANGYRTTIGDADSILRVTGFGKVFSQATFNGQRTSKSKRHYTRSEFEKACSSGPTDILMLHENPGNEWTRRLIFATRPKIIIHSYYMEKMPYLFMDTPTLALEPGGYYFVKYSAEEGFKLF
jgi:hypothetical protein